MLTSLVLASGGIDSSTIAADLAARGEAHELCFVDYAQPAADAERRSLRNLGEHLRVPTTEVAIHGVAIPRSGEIRGRNLMLIAVAAAHRPDSDRMFIGLHSGSGYRDCSPSFVDLMQQVLDFHTDGRCRLIAPFVTWSKADVVALANELRAPLAYTHSCEASGIPCGSCRSCQDREALLAS